MKKIIETVREFSKIFGQWFSLWILNVLFGIVNGVLDLINYPSFPQWLWLTTLGIGFVLAPFYAFHRIRLDRDKLADKLKNREKIISILNKLAELRASGVALRNKGMTELNKEDFINWNSSVDKWHQDLRSKSKELAEFERGLLETLNWVKPLYAPQDGHNKHRKKLNELNETIERLSSLIESYRPVLWN